MKRINLYKALIGKYEYSAKSYYVGAESFEQASKVFQKIIEDSVLKIFFIKEVSSNLLIENDSETTESEDSEA